MTVNAAARARQRRKIFLRSDMGCASRGSIRSPPAHTITASLFLPCSDGRGVARHVSATYFRRAFFGAALPPFTDAVIPKSSSFLPVFSAAASHRGFNPRPAHVSAGLSGLRYFGAIAPRGAPRPLLPRDPFAASRCNLLLVLNCPTFPDHLGIKGGGDLLSELRQLVDRHRFEVHGHSLLV
jgi:hypothetical protein